MSGAPIDFWTLCPEVRKAQGQSFCGAGLVLFLIGQTETLSLIHIFIMTGGKKWTKIKGIRF